MGNDRLVARMKDYFARHVAWLETFIDQAEAGNREPIEEGGQPQVECEAQHAEELACFQSEFEGLMREWEAAEDIGPEAREEVRALARRAAELIERSAALNEGVQKVVQRRQQVIAEELKRLQRGRGSIEKYRPHVGGDGNWIDKKA